MRYSVLLEIIVFLSLGSTRASIVQRAANRQRNGAPKPTPYATQHLPTATNAAIAILTPPPVSPGFTALLQKRDSSTSPTVTIISDGTTLANFPSELCGFYDIFLSTSVACAAGLTCGAVNDFYGCCFDGPNCDSDYVETCAVVDFLCSNYNGWVFYNCEPYANDGGTLYCARNYGLGCLTTWLGETRFMQCQSILLGGDVGNIYGVGVSQVLTRYAGYTLSINNSWSFVSTIKPRPTDPAGFLGNFQAGPPACVNAMTSKCPKFYTSVVQSCYDDTITASAVGEVCYCKAIESHSCPGLCLDGHSPNDYLFWTVPMCDNSSMLTSSNGTNVSDWVELWPEWQNVSQRAYNQLFPWSWRVENDTSELVQANGSHSKRSIVAGENTSNCPSVTKTLSSFAVINIVVFFLSILIANRRFVSLMTCRTLGQSGSKWWTGMALLSVVINLLGNFINALLLKRTPGFHQVPIGSLVIFWCTRPRLGWMVVVLAYITQSMSADKTLYLAAAVSASLAEVILQLIASVYMGMTVNHARVNQFYRNGYLAYTSHSPAHKVSRLITTPHGQDALIMYAGALVWLVSIGGGIIWGIYTFTVVGSIMNSAFAWLFRNLWTGVRIPGSCLFCVILVFVAYPLVAIASLLWVIGVLFYKIALWTYSTIRCCGQKKTQQQEKDTTTGADSHSPTYLLLWNNGTEIVNEEIRKGFRGVRNKHQSGIWDHGISQVSTQQTVNSDEFHSQMGFLTDPQPRLFTWFWMMLLPWISQWLFWAGFVRMAGDTYCPPGVWEMFGVWSAASSIALWFGATS